jgi:tetratricopeptide (TPR) repeat protein
MGNIGFVLREFNLGTMNFHEFQRIYRLARRNLAATVAMGLIGLGCWRVPAQEASKPDAVPHQLEAASSESDAEPLWQEQMHDAWSAMNQKDYGMAEQSCKEALKTAGKFGPNDGHVTTNLIFLAGIYQMENKPDLAEQIFKTAIASREKAVGPDAPDLVWPLDKLANFYYFAEHRYDLATPVCLRIFQIVEKASPRDDAELINRARAVAAVYRIQGQYAKAEPFYQQTLAVAGTNGDLLPECLLSAAGFYQEWGKHDKAESM